MPSIQDVYNVFENDECFGYSKLARRYGIMNFQVLVDRLHEDTERYGESFPYRDERLAEIRQITYDIIQMMVDHHETEAVDVLEKTLGIHLQPSKKSNNKEWTLWHRDTFDHGPASVDACGTVLLSGLIQLWRHVLRESIRDTGETTFSHFELGWTDGKIEDDIEIKLESQKNSTLAKIRRWIYPLTEEEKDLPVEKWNYGLEGRLEDYPLLQTIAKIHLQILRFGRLNRAVNIDPSAESSVLLGFVAPMISAHQLRLFRAIPPSHGK
jgi:hypothetical protein